MLSFTRKTRFTVHYPDGTTSNHNVEREALEKAANAAMLSGENIRITAENVEVSYKATSEPTPDPEPAPDPDPDPDPVEYISMTCVEDWQTWATADGQRHGAKPNSVGPIGGGRGYTRVITEADATHGANTLSELQGELSVVRAGDVLFIRADLDIQDLPTDGLLVPEGVTVASDRGHNGSLGARLAHDSIRGDDFTVFRIQSGGRISGMRIHGPLEHAQPKLDYAHGHGTTKAIETDKNNGKSVEVDNMELRRFIYAGVSLKDRNSPAHHIHHNDMREIWGDRRGYGVVMDQCGAIVEYNYGDAMRHFTAHTGRNPDTNPDSTGDAIYIARENVSGPRHIGQQYDMHGAPESGGNGGVCGVLKLTNNTHVNPYFYDKPDSVSAISVIRGTPYTEGSQQQYNWIWHSNKSATEWNADLIFRCDFANVPNSPNLWAGQDKIER